MFGIISSKKKFLEVAPVIKLGIVIKIFFFSAKTFSILDFYFLSLSYIIVYVGAIAILFLFVIKKTDSSPKLVNSPLLQDKNDKKKKNITNSLEPNSSNINYGLRIISPDYSHPSLKNGVVLGSLTKSLFPLLLIFPTLELDFYSIYNYFVASYFTEFISMTDIQTLGYKLFLAYPLVTILIGILLWSVLIGILRISINN